jgi:O-acetylserine/cysteine efflux transporter
MRLSHVFFALIVVLVWGLNFIAVRIGLNEMPPISLCALRFIAVSIPAIFFIKPPKEASFSIVALYGLVMFGLQFGLLFMGMHVGMTPGMASLLMQVQVFFSMFFGAIFLGERPNLGQILGALIAFTGIGIVALHFDNHVTLLGFVLIMAAAATWGIGNLITKKIGKASVISVIAWGSVVASFPMVFASLIFEGKDSVFYTYESLSWNGIGALAYTVYISTWIGYGVWNWLISRYPVSMVAPYTLLVPLVGIVSSIIIFDEPFQLWKLFVGLLIVTGLCINILSTRLSLFKVQTKAA